MRIVLTGLLIICLNIFVTAQKYSFGKISTEELQEKQSAIKETSPAEIIYKEVFIEADVHGNLEIQITERVKIYQKDRAEEFLTYEVPLHKNRTFLDKISNFRASTYNLENGKVVEMKVKNDQTYKEEKNKYLDLFKFTFPDVKDGSVIEYKYVIYSPWIQEIPIQYFEYKIPLRYMNYTVKALSIIQYLPDLRGQNAAKIRAEQKRQDIAGVAYPYNVVNLKIENVKPYEEEPFVLNHNNVRTSIRYELSSIEIPGELTRNYSTTWKEIGNNLLQSSDFGGYYRSAGQEKKIVPALIEGMVTNEEKARAILKYVQTNYIWNKYNGIYTDQSLSKFVTTKTGSVPDMNLFLVAMLREAGIDANPIVLSTVSNGMLNYSFPSLQKLNYVIAGYYDTNGLNILDATSKVSDLNQIPKRALNYRGFYVKKDDIKEVNLSNKVMSTNMELLNYEIKPDLEFVGTYVNKSTKYLGMGEIEKYDENKNQYESYIKSKYSFPINKLDFSNTGSDFKTSFSFDSASNAEKVGDKIVFNPLIFLKENEQMFRAENRSYPIEFGSPTREVKVVIVTIPDGYKVEDFPKSKKYLMEDNLGTYSYVIKTSGNQIELKTELVLNEYFIPSDYYGVLKEFWQAMIEMEAQLVSLVKE